MDRELELSKRKSLALFYLGLFSAVFAATFLFQANLWVGLLRAVSEAAMVGALADWFAVVALFRRLPIPFVSSHTGIIAKNKDQIADSLAVFVEKKFLTADAIVQLLSEHKPAEKLSAWLLNEKNTIKLGTYLINIVSGMMNFIEDAAVQKFIRNAVNSLLKNVDLSKSTGSILEAITKNGRHQALLDEGINQFSILLSNQDTQDFIAQGIVKWLKDEYTLTEKILPSEWIGERGASMVVSAASNLIADINNNPEHSVRKRFDNYTQEFIDKLKSSPEFAEKGEEIKRYLQNDETFNQFLNELWGSLKQWINDDLHNSRSQLRKNVIASGLWIGKALSEDEDLRNSLNEHMKDAAKKMAPDFTEYLTSHIRKTIKGWNTEEMCREIELYIGPDLQWIRINGTFVGGFIGFVLFVTTHAASIFHAIGV
ncbi:MAG TPA: DUF445 family protein [Cellvibrio sp.]|nr:DUF445 family protein [Cellvibrio sp.]